MQPQETPDAVSAIETHFRSISESHFTALDEELAREIKDVESRHEQSRKQSEAVLGEYWLNINAAARLHQGIENVVQWLEGENSRMGAVPEDHPRFAVLDRERERRNLHARSLRSRLNYGAILIGYITHPARPETDEADESQQPSTTAERLTSLQKLVDSSYRKSLVSYLQQNVKPETKTLWETRAALRAQLEDSQDPESMRWLEAREALWTEWRTAIESAGLQIYIPEEGSPVDYDCQSVEEVIDIFSDDATTSSWGPDRNGRVWSVKYPGITWEAQNLQVLIAGVTETRVVDPPEQEVPVQREEEDISMTSFPNEEAMAAVDSPGEYQVSEHAEDPRDASPGNTSSTTDSPDTGIPLAGDENEHPSTAVIDLDASLPTIASADASTMVGNNETTVPGADFTADADNATPGTDINDPLPSTATGEIEANAAGFVDGSTPENDIHMDESSIHVMDDRRDEREHES